MLRLYDDDDDEEEELASRGGGSGGVFPEAARHKEAWSTTP